MNVKRSEPNNNWGDFDERIMADQSEKIRDLESREKMSKEKHNIHDDIYYGRWNLVTSDGEVLVSVEDREQIQIEKCYLIPDEDVGENGIWRCSVCGNAFHFESDPSEFVKFCWNCGRRMEV